MSMNEMASGHTFAMNSETEHATVHYISSPVPRYYDPARDLVLMQREVEGSPLVDVYVCSRARLIDKEGQTEFPTAYDLFAIPLGIYDSRQSFDEDYTALKKRIRFLGGDLCARNDAEKDFQQYTLYDAEQAMDQKPYLLEEEVMALHNQIAADYKIPPVPFHVLYRKTDAQRLAWYKQTIKSSGWTGDVDCPWILDVGAFYCDYNRHIAYFALPTKHTVVHEMAHAVTDYQYKDYTPTGHGPLFVRVFLEMTKRYLAGDVVEKFQSSVQAQDLTAHKFLQTYDVEVDPVFKMRSEKAVITLKNTLSFIKPKSGEGS